MSTIDSAKKPGRGRPVVDSQAVNVRMEKIQLDALDSWRDRQTDKPGRPEAIRQLVARALTSGRK